jgi:hypothetical protein
VFVPVAFGSRAFEVLRVLIAARGDLVSKDEIMAAVWPGTVVEDNNLTAQIAALRGIFDQGRVQRRPQAQPVRAQQLDRAESAARRAGRPGCLGACNAKPPATSSRSHVANSKLAPRTERLLRGAYQQVQVGRTRLFPALLNVVPTVADQAPPRWSVGETQSI